NIEVDTKNGNTLVSTVKYGYSGLGQRTQASSPFAPGESQVNTRFTYDGMGRLKTVVPPSGGSTQYDYNGNTVLATDPSGKLRKSYIDALGRLVRVDEPGWG